MKPALKTEPVTAMPAMTRYVCASRGISKGTMPHASRSGTGTQNTRSVHTPMSDVSRFGYSPKGNGRMTSSTSGARRAVSSWFSSSSGRKSAESSRGA